MSARYLLVTTDAVGGEESYCKAQPHHHHTNPITAATFCILPDCGWSLLNFASCYQKERHARTEIRVLSSSFSADIARSTANDGRVQECDLPSHLAVDVGTPAALVVTDIWYNVRQGSCYDYSG